MSYDTVMDLQYGPATKTAETVSAITAVSFSASQCMLLNLDLVNSAKLSKNH